MSERRIRTISEPADLRALAHPLRLRLLGALRLDGPATASGLARRLGVSSGLTSYHLRMLAERGFVEDDPGRHGGRERWWRAAHDAHAWEASAGEPLGDAGRVAATRALNLEAARLYARWLEHWGGTAPGDPEPWRSVMTSQDRWVTLAPAQARRLAADMEELIASYAHEEDAGDDARRVGIIFAMGLAEPRDGPLP